MPDRTFGWDYPPGVTGNEPQIAGVDPEEACAQCGAPFDYDEPIKLTAEVYLCSQGCEARWVVGHAQDFPPRTVLDAAGDLEDVEVRVLRGALEPAQGCVVGRRGTTAAPLAYSLVTEQSQELEVLLSDVTGVKVVANG